jgi:hypothetical protein
VYAIIYPSGFGIATVALNVGRTVSRPMLSTSMVSDFLKAYKADRKDFENLEEELFENSLDGILYAVENGQIVRLASR